MVSSHLPPIQNTILMCTALGTGLLIARMKHEPGSPEARRLLLAVGGVVCVAVAATLMHANGWGY
jgi:hypothetical protein